jgi:hypothetical protein
MIKTASKVFVFAFFLELFLFLPFLHAKASDVDVQVQFEKTPLFTEINLSPGAGTWRWIRVSNQTTKAKAIFIEATEYPRPLADDDLSHVLIIAVRQGGNVVLGPMVLSDFYLSGEIYLSDVAAGKTTQYDVGVSLPVESSSGWENKTTGFDLSVDTEKVEDGCNCNGCGCGITLFSGCGGSSPGGLVIFDSSVRVVDISRTSAVVIWATSSNSSSQVVFGSENENHNFNPEDATGLPPAYGYSHVVLEYDFAPKTINHLVLISGLDPGVKYFFRAVSRDPLAVSKEYSFTTLDENINIPLIENSFQMGGGLLDSWDNAIAISKGGGSLLDNNQDNSLAGRIASFIKNMAGGNVLASYSEGEKNYSEGGNILPGEEEKNDRQELTGSRESGKSKEWSRLFFASVSELSPRIWIIVLYFITILAIAFFLWQRERIKNKNRL